MTKTITLRLEPKEYEQLLTAAKRQNMRPSALARQFVRDGLEGTETDEERRRRGLRALARLEALRNEIREAGYPSVDAVEVMRRSREELEERSIF